MVAVNGQPMRRGMRGSPNAVKDLQRLAQARRLEVPEVDKLFEAID